MPESEQTTPQGASDDGSVVSTDMARVVIDGKSVNVPVESVSLPLTVDGNVSLSTGRDLQAAAQRVSSSDQRFQAAAQLRKEAEELSGSSQEAQKVFDALKDARAGDQQSMENFASVVASTFGEDPNSVITDMRSEMMGNQNETREPVSPAMLNEIQELKGQIESLTTQQETMSSYVQRGMQDETEKSLTPYIQLKDETSGKERYPFAAKFPKMEGRVLNRLMELFPPGHTPSDEDVFAILEQENKELEGFATALEPATPASSSAPSPTVLPPTGGTPSSPGTPEPKTLEEKVAAIKQKFVKLNQEAGLEVEGSAF